MSRERTAVRAASAAATLPLLAAGLAVGAWIALSYGHNDFAHYYLSSRLLIEGRMPYGVRLDHLPWARGLTLNAGVVYGTDTPVFLALFAPLALLPPQAAYLLWSFLQLASLAVALVLSLRLVEGRLPPWAVRLLAAALVGGFAVADHFLFSQTQLLLLALVLAAYHLSVRGRHGWALALVTVAGLLKLYPLALLPWFAVRASRRDGWKPFVPSAALLAGALAAAPALWMRFVQLGLPHVSAFVAGPYVNVSLVGAVVQGVWTARDLEVGTTVVRLLWVGLATLSLGILYARIWRRPGRPEREFAAMVCGMLLATTVLWTHYLVWAIPAVVLLTADAFAGRRPGALILLATAYLFTVGACNEVAIRLEWATGGLAAALGDLTTFTLVVLAAWFAIRDPAEGERPRPEMAIAPEATGPSGR